MLKVDRERLAALPKDQQDEALRILDAYEQEIKNNPLLAYRPHAKQVKFHEGKEQLKAFLGGNRSGKTTCGMVDDLIQACDRDVIPDHLLPYKKFDPPFHGRIVCPGEDIMFSVVHQKIREWCPKDQLVGGGFSKAYEKSRGILHFKNGSFFDFLTYGQDLDKFGGTAKHRIHYDEEPPREIRMEGKMRLIDYDGADEIFTMTPQSGMDWMFDEIWEPWQKGTLKHGKIIVVDMDENPYISERQKEIALEGYSREELEARKKGRFVHFHGMIYGEFDRNKHVIPELPEVPPGSKVYVGIDPGMRHMAAVVWCYLNPEDTMVVFDELALQGHTVKQVAEAIKLRNMRWGQQAETQRVPLHPDWYVIDPSARNIMHQTGRSDQMEFMDHGIVTILGQNSVTAGINRVKERLQANRLLVAANCQTTIDQFRRYRWATPNRSEDEPKERPVKSDDHCFPAGTMIETSDGPRPVEQIGPGDLVWTRAGLFPVLLARQTREADLQRVVADGCELVGTTDHRVWISGRGWTTLDSVRYGDMMLRWTGEKKPSGTASSSTAIQTPATLGLATTSRQPQCAFIARFGNCTTARSPRAITSTTSTRTQRTTTYPTWNVYPLDSISATTSLQSGAPKRANTWNVYSRSHTRGTEPLRVEHGIAHMLSESLTYVSREPTPASAAVLSTGREIANLVNGFAPISAGLQHAAQKAATTSSAHASSAGASLRSIGTHVPVLAPVAVRHGSPAGQSAVYALTVLGPPEYFANGLLVRNCMDAIRYVVASRPHSPQQTREEEALSPMERAFREDVSGKSYSRKRQSVDPQLGGIFC